MHTYVHVCYYAFRMHLHADGKSVAISFVPSEGDLVEDSLTWSTERSRDVGELLLLVMAFGAVITQYAIALELRLAYCGLQDTNLDLQVTKCKDVECIPGTFQHVTFASSHCIFSYKTNTID